MLHLAACWASSVERQCCRTVLCAVLCMLAVFTAVDQLPLALLLLLLLPGPARPCQHLDALGCTLRHQSCLCVHE
jgi:hypothetical protein